MFPLHDHNPTRSVPIVTWAIILANVLVFLAMLPDFGNQRALDAIAYTFGVVPAEISRGQHLYTLITSQFVHGGLLHIAGNMLFLYIFGDNLEDALGHVNFLIFYLLCGVAAALAQTLPDPNSTVPMIGASGAIAGVMGGYIMLYPRARVDVLVVLIIFITIIPMPAWLMLGYWFLLETIAGASMPTAGGGVAHLAHVGGFIAGVIGILPVWLARGGTDYWSRTHGRPEYEERIYPATHTRVPIVRRRRR